MAQADTPRSGYYVEMDEKLRRKSKFQRIVKLSNQTEAEVFFRLHEFWTWIQQAGEDYHDDLGILPGIDMTAVVNICGGDERLWSALADEQVDWARFEPQGIVVPGFAHRFSRAARKRRNGRNQKFDKRNPKGVEKPLGLDLPHGETVAKDFANSIFNGLTRQQLLNFSAMLVWFDAAVNEAKPVVKDTETDLLRVLTAARYSAKHGKEPAAYFAYIVGRKQWHVIESQIPMLNEAMRFVRELGNHRVNREKRSQNLALAKAHEWAEKISVKHA